MQEDPETPFNPVLVDAAGVPLRARRDADRRCPRCGSGPDRRVGSSGFGIAHPVCGRCGHEWSEEVWHGEDVR